MDIDTITPHAVREALRAVRFAKPLTRNPLLGMAALAVRLRDGGIPDTGSSRGWELGRYLYDIVCRRLTTLRGAVGVTASAERTPERELDALDADFRPGNSELEAWSLLYIRYFGAGQAPVGRIAARVGLTERTFERRLGLGHRALAVVLREEELAAASQLHVFRGAPAHRRIVADGAAETLEAETAMALLLAAVRDDERMVRLPPSCLEEIGRRAPADLAEYRLGRIAEWSDPRYALDERFVELTILVDQGEEARSGRWAKRDQRYGGLREALAALADPALVLLGPPGCGKSTLLRRLELDTAVDGLRELGEAVTFFVPLNTYRPVASGEPPPSPGAWLAEQWATRFPLLPGLEDLLAEGRVILLLDALNEMPHRGAADYRARVMQWKQYLHDVVTQGRGNRILFSCRSLDYAAPLSTPTLRVPQLQVEAMGDDEVRRFLGLYAPSEAEALWAELAGTSEVALLRSPYFLRLLVEEVAATGLLQTGRAALFTGFVRRALQREIERDNPLFQPDDLVTQRDYERVVSARRWRDAHELPERGRLFPKLATLAHGIQVMRGSGEVSQVRVSYDEAVALLGDDRAADVLRAGEALGVLDEDRDRDEILYRHQLLQEYFAARVLAVHPEPEAVRVEWRADRISPTADEVIDGLSAGDELPGLPLTGWEETTRLAAAMTGDAAAFLRGVMEANLALAGRIAAQTEVRKRLPEELLDELRWALVHRSRDPQADLRDRIACGYAVGDLGDPRYERRTGPYGEYVWPPMIEIPGGVYPIGDDEPIEWTEARTGERWTDTDHIPRHEVAIAAFRIGQFAVTNAEWACFIHAGGYDDERWWDTADAKRWQRGELANEGAKWNNRLWRRRFKDDPTLLDRIVEEGIFSNEEMIERWRGWMVLDDEGFEQVLATHWQPKRRTTPTFWKDERYNRPSQPVVGVCWYEARAYCNWLSSQTARTVRPPTEVEWEAVARGQEARAYPWGEVFDRLKANTYETHVRKPTPVGVFPEGDTAEGVGDLAGNTWDWTLSLWGEYTSEEPEVGYRYPYDASDGREDVEAPPSVARVSRGGSWSDDHTNARTALRNLNQPDLTSINHGLRLVLSPPT